LLLQKFMKFCLILTLSFFTICCKNQENTFELEGTWKDVSCQDKPENCESRFPIIIIDTSFQDSIEVRTKLGSTKKLWTNKKYQAASITLENNYESLLFPIYNKNTLAYYDNTEDRFVYYKKTKSDLK
jgi:hypothetical protein